MCPTPTSELEDSSHKTHVATHSGSKVFKLALPGIFLASLCLLPYLNKAFTIDDPVFMLSARQVLRNPLQPFSFPICWQGNETCVQSDANLGMGATQGLMGYLLVPVVLAGNPEWLAHTFQLVLAFVAVIAMVRLALRLGCDQLQAILAGLLLVAIPPFLPMASTAMPDTVALALGLTGINFLLAWKRDRRWSQAVVASVTLALASYARAHVVLLIPLGALWLFDELEFRSAIQQLRRQAYVWIPVVAAATLLLTIILITQDHGPKERIDRFIGTSSTLGNLYAYLLFLVFPIPLALVWIAMSWRKAPLLLIGPLILAVTLYFVSNHFASIVEVWGPAAALFGLATTAHLGRTLLARQDRSDSLLYLWVLLPLPVIFYNHFPIKYMLIVVPAVILIVIRTLEALPKRQALALTCVLATASAAYSCVILRADADFAEYGRQAARELIAPHIAAGEKVWYGGQWGFYWYAEANGARISKPGVPGPNPGELLAVGIMEGGDLTRNRFPKRELVDSRVYGSPHGRTMGFGGGLYSNYFGDAPWAWAPAATNVYQLWRVR